LKGKKKVKAFVQRMSSNVKEEEFQAQKKDFHSVEFRKLGTYVFPIGSSIIYSIPPPPPPSKKKKITFSFWIKL